MQNAKRVTHSTNSRSLIPRALSLILVAILTQACQTTPQRYLTPDEQNAKTNAWAAWANSVYQYNQLNQPTYGPANPVRPIQNVIIQPQQPACAPFCLQQPY